MLKIKAPILLLVLMTVLLTSGCNIIMPGSSSSTTPSPIKSLSLSRAPKLGKTAELVFINNMKFYTSFFANQDHDRSNCKVRAWVEFRYANINGSYSEAKYGASVLPEKVVTSGNLSWEGNPFDIGDNLELRGTVRFPWEGVWEITGYIEAEGFGSSFVNKLFKKQIRVAVTKKAAAVFGTIGFIFSPLACLDNFSYGRVGKRVPDERYYPTILEVDISRIPAVGEEAIVNCIIRSLYDVPDFSAEITFYKRFEDNSVQKIPESRLIISGDLKWEGALNKDKPVEFSVSIRLPEEGDWKIYVFGDYPTNERIGFSDNIKMNISGNIRSFGWEERRSKSKNVPEPKPAPIPK